MKKSVSLCALALALALAAACKKGPEPPARPASPGLFVIGIFQSVDSPTANEVRKGILRALEASGLRDGENVRVRIRIASGDISEVYRIAQEYMAEKVNLLVPLSTQCLQAALIAGTNIPIVFGSVATPFQVGAGRSAADHLSHVTGVASTGPVRQAVQFIREVLPKARRLGTLWTPTEVNSEYYLELAKVAAAEAGFEVVAVPVEDAHRVLQSAQVLVNQKVDALFPISDNTINSAFEVLGPVAEENRIPLFGGFLRSVEFGASAAVGYNFYDMGYKTGRIVVRVMNGESPARIPIQFMSDAQVHLNLEAASRQGVEFPGPVLRRAARVIRVSSAPEPGPEAGIR